MQHAATRLRPFALLALLLLALAATTAEHPTRLAASPPTPAPSSLLFVENVGQFDARVRFQLLGTGNPLWLTDEGIVTTIFPAGQGEPQEGVTVSLAFDSASGGEWEPSEPQPTVLSYYRGSDPTDWRERVPTWGALRFRERATGRALTLRGEGGRLELRPGGGQGAALPLRLEGASLAGVRGNVLQLDSALGPLELALPVSGEEWEVEGVSAVGEALRLRVPALSSRRADEGGLTELLYGTYVGGGAWDEGYDVAYDSGGNLYIGGHTQSLPFPTRTGRTPAPHAVEAFLTRLDPMTGQMDYMVQIIGDVEDFTTAITVDGAGNAYAAGFTDSTDFPTTPGAFDETPNGGFDGFAFKVRPNGTLVYSTILGSSESDSAEDIGIDGAGSAYVTGGTWGQAFPTTPDSYDTSHNGLRDLFLLRLAPDGGAVTYGTFLGGSGQEQGEGVALLDSNTVYLTGWTRSANFPTTPGSHDPSPNGDFEAFATKLSLSSPSSLPYSTFLGGSDEDRGYDILVLPSGESIVTGTTRSSDYPTTPGYFDRTFGGGTCDFVPCADGFLTRLSSDGAALRFSGFLGGSKLDSAQAMSFSGSGHITVAGETGSANFPVSSDAYDASLDGERDAFIAVVRADGSALHYGSFLGGSLRDDASGVAVRPNGELYLAGKSESSDFPTSLITYDRTPNGGYDAFGAVLAAPALPTPPPSPTATRTPTPTTPDPTATPSETPTTPDPTATPTAGPAARLLFLPLVRH